MEEVFILLERFVLVVVALSDHDLPLLPDQCIVLVLGAHSILQILLPRFLRFRSPGEVKDSSNNNYQRILSLQLLQILPTTTVLILILSLFHQFKKVAKLPYRLGNPVSLV